MKKYLLVAYSEVNNWEFNTKEDVEIAKKKAETQNSDLRYEIEEIEEE